MYHERWPRKSYGAQSQLAKLQAADAAYETFGVPVPPAAAKLEQTQQALIGKDQTQIATLTKELPYVPLSEATCNFGSIALVLVGVIAIANVKRRRAATSEVRQTPDQE